MSFNASGEAELKAASAALGQVVRAAATGLPVQQVMETVGIVLVNEIKLQLSQPGSGRVYYHGNVAHRASAPGEPPAVDHGTLRNGIDFQVGEDAQGPYVIAGSPSDVAVLLEFGTANIAPRPFFRPAVEAATPKMAQAIAAGVERAQRQAIARMPKTIELPS